MPYLRRMKANTLSRKIGVELKKKKQNLAFAESCTGGYISHLITAIPGSSTYFMGGVIAYDNKIKRNILSVKPGTLKKFGAVSSECAAEMALGIQAKFGTHYAVAVTGIAGPAGAVKGKPVGTVYIAVATPKTLIAQRFQFKGSRLRVIEQTAQKALEILSGLL